MKINEVEAAVGVTKKNIRFYEEEGLISPRREPGNGYRSYSEADVERLRRIKLLRKLDVPLAEIRQMLEGECTLAEGMTRQLERLHTRRTDLDEAVNFCTLLQMEPVSLNELDVEQTLARLTAKEEQGVSFVNIEQTDRKAERVRGALVGAGLFTAIMLLSIGIMAWAFCVDPQDVPPLPLLVVLYPLVIVLVLLSFFDRFWKGRTEVYAFSMLFSLFFSIFDGCKTAGISLGGLTEKVMQLPLASLGIGWVLPALVGFLIGISPIGRKIGEYVRNR